MKENITIITDITIPMTIDMLNHTIVQLDTNATTSSHFVSSFLDYESIISKILNNVNLTV